MVITRRLYYDDAYVREFAPHIVDRSPDGLRLYFDETACYPTSGGQPHDLGTVGGVALVEVEDEGDRVVHVVASPVQEMQPKVAIDWGRRFDHMQQHTGQHLLSAVLAEEYGIQTLSFHLGTTVSTIDVNAADVPNDVLRSAEQACQKVIYENRPVRVTYEDATVVEGLRKASAREGLLRIVSIEGMDRSACGGTHVKATGEIGALFLRRTDKIRGVARLEFLCGLRAARQARSDYEALNRVARVFSSTPEDAPALVEAQQRNAVEAGKAQQKLQGELAEFQARDLYAQTTADGQGRRVIVRAGAGELGEADRRLAQSFTAQSQAIWLQTGEANRAVLLAVSEDSGVHAGHLLKEVLQAHGGRGGGSARSAQGTVAEAGALVALRDSVVKKLNG